MLCGNRCDGRQLLAYITLASSVVFFVAISMYLLNPVAKYFWSCIAAVALFISILTHNLRLCIEREAMRCLGKSLAVALILSLSLYITTNIDGIVKALRALVAQ